MKLLPTKSAIVVAMMLALASPGCTAAHAQGTEVEGGDAGNAGQKEGATAFFEPKLENGRGVIRLPAQASEVVVGGAGRYLVMPMKKIESIAVVDLCAGKVIKVLQLPGGETHVAAGKTKLFVSSAENNSLTRYDLATLSRELTVASPPGGVQWMGMGSGSNGPVVIASGKQTLLLDPVTSRSTEISWDHWAHEHDNWPAPSMTVSGDGRMIVATGGGWAGVEIVAIDGGKVLERTSAPGGHPRVSSDGRLLFFDDRVADSRFKPAAGEWIGYGFPTASANYNLSLKQGRRGEADDHAELRMYLAGTPSAIWTLKDVGDFTRSTLPEEQRIFFVPEANLLAAVGAGDDQILLRHFNVMETLEAAGIDYLFINSNPVQEAERGKGYLYQMDVKSKRGGVTFELMGAPEGMTLSAAGKVEWNVPKDFAREEARVVVLVKDGTSQEVYQTFAVRLHGGTPPKPETQPGGTKVRV